MLPAYMPLRKDRKPVVSNVWVSLRAKGQVEQPFSYCLWPRLSYHPISWLVFWTHEALTRNFNKRISVNFWENRQVTLAPVAHRIEGDLGTPHLSPPTGLYAPRTGKQNRTWGLWCSCSFKPHQLLRSLRGWSEESHRGKSCQISNHTMEVSHVGTVKTGWETHPVMLKQRACVAHGLSPKQWCAKKLRLCFKVGIA